ncbi:MAG: hypothetical protein JXR84_25595 [Anaerolineae bacterium]|nr:hypothetical protein [Anaerolineae bacterium]
MKKWSLLINLLGLGLVLALLSQGIHAQSRDSYTAGALPTYPLVVLTEPDDPYAALADEIAQAEQAVRLHVLEELKSVDAAYVIYVASPAWLSESKLMALSTLSLTTGRYPAVGIISGSTPAQARALWLRGAEVRASRGFVASASDVNARLDTAQIWELTADPIITRLLTKANLLHTLEEADYFYWARHVGSRTWFWYEGESPMDSQELTGDELPVLGPVVIHTPSCRSFVPWTENSIALAFVDHGAAAYLGHLYAPISSGYFIGHLYTLPGYDTWPGIPMGVLAQIQNRASERAFASQPFMFMLGDPRIALQTSAPYTITSDVSQGNRRVIQGYWKSSATTPGILPLRIPDGAAYPFIQVKGIGAVADDGPFYNGNIQTLNVQGDKAVLIVHPEGTFEVTLRAAVPPLWREADALRDAFELVWCTIAPLQTPLGFVPLALLLVVGIIKLIRKKPLRPYSPVVSIGAGWATLQLVFCLLRAGNVSVSSYAISPTPVALGFAFVGTSACVTLGLVWMLGTRKSLGKLLGWMVCLAPTLALLGFYTGILTVLNVFAAQKSMERIWSLNYVQVRMIAIVALIEALIFLTAYRRLRGSSGRDVEG